MSEKLDKYTKEDWLAAGHSERSWDLTVAAGEIASITGWRIYGVEPGASFYMRCGTMVQFTSDQALYELKELLTERRPEDVGQN